MRKFNTPDHLQTKLQKYVTANEGLEANADHGKLGYDPTKGVGSMFTLQMGRLVQPIALVTMMVMQSYGTRWEGSKIRVDVYATTGLATGSLLAGMDMLGYHSKNTSETANYQIHLGNRSGTGIKLVVKLVDGVHNHGFSLISLCIII